jgi:hypothetical protein
MWGGLFLEDGLAHGHLPTFRANQALLPLAEAEA